MSELRKSKLALAMLCTLLFGGNAGAIEKDMSKTISKNDLSTKDKELENRKLDDSGNKFLKYALYFLGLGKLVDEGVGIAEANEYIKNEKLYPLGKLSIYKNLVARSYRAKTIETMRKLVGESNKNNERIQNFFNNVVELSKGYKSGDIIHTQKINEEKDNVFDIGLKFGKFGIYDENNLDIKYIFKGGHGYEKLNDEGIPEFIEEYVKAVLGVSVEDCDKILVSTNENNKYIAFVKGNVCLKLAYSGLEKRMHFILCGISDQLSFDNGGCSLDLDYGGYCFEITLPYMECVLGMKHDKNYINIIDNNDKVNSYSFYGQIFRDLFNDWKGDTPSGIEFMGQADKIFPDLFEKEFKLIKE